MTSNGFIASLAGACLAVLALGQAARADILINVDKTTQRMTVTVDGEPRYTWPVSTGGPATTRPTAPSGRWRKDKDHRSKE